jgi:hypothetical protein
MFNNPIVGDPRSPTSFGIDFFFGEHSWLAAGLTHHCLLAAAAWRTPCRPVQGPSSPQPPFTCISSGLAAEFYIKIGFLRITLVKILIGGVPKECTKGKPACGEGLVSTRPGLAPMRASCDAAQTQHHAMALTCVAWLHQHGKHGHGMASTVPGLTHHARMPCCSRRCRHHRHHRRHLCRRR